MFYFPPIYLYFVSLGNNISVEDNFAFTPIICKTNNRNLPSIFYPTYGKPILIFFIYILVNHLNETCINPLNYSFVLIYKIKTIHIFFEID